MAAAMHCLCALPGFVSAAASAAAAADLPVLAFAGADTEVLAAAAPACAAADPVAIYFLVVAQIKKKDDHSYSKVS
jgi:hypothetical protein